MKGEKKGDETDVLDDEDEVSKLNREKEAWNSEDLCYICQGKIHHYVVCAKCEYVCCSGCYECRPDMFLTEERVDILASIYHYKILSTDEEKTEMEVEEEIAECISENKDWLPDDLCTEKFDVCKWCSKTVPNKSNWNLLIP